MLRARSYAGTIMSESGHLLSAQTSKVIIPSSYPSKTGRNKLLLQPCKIIAASKKKTDLDLSLIREKKSRNPRQLIRLPTSDGNWTCEYQFSFRELKLEDLVADDGQEDTQVSIVICVQKHAIFGFSVEGKITTTFNSICSICSSPYCREINSTFNVWVLRSRRRKDRSRLPELGSVDPSVIYVKPGREVDLDSVVQDTIRLELEANETCSESCEDSDITFESKEMQHVPSLDKRWSKLLELKKGIL